MDNLFFSASAASDDVCFVLISYSGEVKSLLKIATKLKRRQIPTIVITSYGDNSLSRMFDTVLHLSTQEKLIDNLGNFSSLLSISFILDVLYGSIFNEHYQQHYETKIRFAREFEEYRRSTNPLINDHQ